MSEKVQEINFFKGVVCHPNAISSTPGTFRDIKNGWHLRDGIVDKRPGFQINSNQPKPPGFLSQFTGLKTVGDFTFFRQDNTIGVYSPDTGFVFLSGADTVDVFQAAVVKVLPDPNNVGHYFMYIGKQLTTDTQTEPFILVFDMSTKISGERIGQFLGGLSDSATVTTPFCNGIDVEPIDGSSYRLLYSRVDTNKIYSWDLVFTTPGVLVQAGNGSPGLSVGSGTTSHALGPINGIKFRKVGSAHHIYACVSNGLVDINLTGNSISLLGGSTSPGFANGTGAAAAFNMPLDVDYFSAAPTILYVADYNNNAIRIIEVGGDVSTLTLTGGTLSHPRGIVCLTPLSGSVEPALLLYVSDSGHNRIVSVNSVTGAIVVVAGTGTSDYVDGSTDAAAFLGIYGLCVWQDSDDSGVALSSNLKILVADYSANVIREVDVGNAIGTVSTFVGNNVGGYQKNNLSGFIGGYLTVPTDNPNGTAIPTTPQSPDYGEAGFSMFELNNTLYLNTNRGVVAFDTATLKSSATSNIIRYAGAPVAYDLVLSLVGSPGTLLPADYAVGYRLVWGYKTAAGKTVLGAPSSLAILANPVGAGSAKNVTLSSIIPPGPDTTWTYQVYRTLTSFVNTASGDPVPPGDTEFLVYEASPTLSDLQNGFVTFTDSTPDALVGAALYTNATQETLSQANTIPPRCQDMCLFNGMAIYANTLQKQIAFVNLVGVTGAFTVTVTGDHAVNLTGNASSEDPSIGQFQYFTSGTPAANIQNTAQSIVRTLNGYPKNTLVFAQYVSPYNGTPGQISLTARNFGQDPFYMSGSGSFSPPLPPSNDGSYASVAEQLPNGLYVSKTLQPDAVPLVNNFTVGSSSDSIRRVIPLRTSCIVIKERSIWRLVGDDPSSISISLLDNTVSLRSDHSVSLLNNEVYALSTQGVVAISDNGVRIVSRDIEFKLTQVTGSLQMPMDLMNCCWGFGSDDWRMYFLSVFISDSTAVTWCYSPFSNSWARWDLIVYALTVTDGRILTACIDDPNATEFLKKQNPYMIAQRTTPPVQLASSYADDGGTSVIIEISGNIVTFASALGFRQPIEWYYGWDDASNIGWVFFAHNRYYYIQGFTNGNSFIVNDVTGLALDDVVTVYRAIDFYLRFNPITAGNTFNAKQWGDFLMAIESKNAYQFSAGFLQNYSPEGTAFLEQIKVVDQLQAVGSGETPEDADLYLEQVQRLSVLKQVAFGNMLEIVFQHEEAFSELVLKAIGIETRGLQSTKVQQ